MYDFVDRRVDTLDCGCRFLIWSMRAWAQAIANRRCPTASIGTAFAKWNMLGTLPHFHMMMMILSRDGLQPFKVAPIECARVGEDEALLLELVRSQQGTSEAMVKATLAMMIDQAMIRAMFVSLGALSEALVNVGALPQSAPSTTHHTPRDRRE